MKMTVSPLLAAGLIIFVVYVVLDKVIVAIPSWLGFPALIVAVVLIVLGGLRAKN